MEKLLQNYNLNQYEVFSYFSCEILCLIGVLINIILYLFINKKYNIKRYSDLITFGIFSINSLISIGVFLKNKLTFGDFNFEIFNKNFFLNNEIFLFKSLFFIFLACFILCTYKLTRNTFFKGALINSSLLLLGITSSFLLQAQNELLAFIFLDLSALFIYKFASSAQIRKYETYSFGFVLMNTTSSILFYSFYLLTFLLKENMQLSIVQICLVCALLLKIGLFPIYNYIPNKYTKNNLAYSMLLFGFLPYLGIITFIKLQQNINSLNEIFLIVITSVCLVSMLSCAINAIKTKNLVKFFANVIYVNCSFYIISLILSQNYALCKNTLFLFMFLVFSIYGLIAVLKINLKAEKINIPLLKNLFIKNRSFCILFSVLILLISNIIPNKLLINNVSLLKNVYLFDKLGFYIAMVYLFSNCLIILNSIKIIKTMYQTKYLFCKLPKLTKRTTCNYVVPYVVIILLILMMFL